MNKTDLIGKLAERLDGDRRTAQAAVENVIDLIQRAVQSGDHVSISGFGVFEKRARAPRTARNPRTGQAVPVEQTIVPAFRPGKYFKDVIAGAVTLPPAGSVPLTARAAAAAARPRGGPADPDATTFPAESLPADAGVIPDATTSPASARPTDGAPITDGGAGSDARSYASDGATDHQPAERTRKGGHKAAGKGSPRSEAKVGKHAPDVKKAAGKAGKGSGKGNGKHNGKK
jgi:DNA-binding protein HU-beta